VAEKQFYSWQEFDQDCEKIIEMLYERRGDFDGVWGPPRGGLPLAVALSHGLGLPFLPEPKSIKTLIVDDIADTGKTLEKFSLTHFTVTLFYHWQSVTIPNIYLREKNEGWIIFPWEKGKE